jgi:hypothetical protein
MELTNVSGICAELDSGSAFMQLSPTVKQITAIAIVLFFIITPSFKESGTALHNFRD